MKNISPKDDYFDLEDIKFGAVRGRVPHFFMYIYLLF